MYEYKLTSRYKEDKQIERINYIISMSVSVLSLVSLVTWYASFIHAYNAL